MLQMHGSKFPERKTLSQIPHPLLLKENRPGGDNFNDRANKHKKRDEQEYPYARGGNVKGSFPEWDGTSKYRFQSVNKPVAIFMPVLATVDTAIPLRAAQKVLI